MKLPHWKGKKVLILGLGQYPKGSGMAATLFALRQGAEVVVSDQKTAKDLGSNVTRLQRFSRVRFRLGEHHLEDIQWADIVIRHQRVRHTSSEMRLARRLGKQIESAESLFMRLCPCPIVGITGTRGKTTTTTLVAKMLGASKKRVWLGGNILVAPLTFLSRIRSNDIVVLELSSFQLEATGDAGISPHVACITNLLHDHQNAYENMAEYAEAKAQIFRHQTSQDFLVLNGDDVFCRSVVQEVSGVVRVFSREKLRHADAWLETDRLMMRERTREYCLAQRTALRVSGEHNALNMLAAALTARAAGASLVGIRSALKAFRGVPHRQEIVTVKQGITFINDTTATTPDGTIAALRTFGSASGRVFLILGGADKELDFSLLAKILRSMKHVFLLVLPGSAYEPLTTALNLNKVKWQDVKDLTHAVTLARRDARPGDAVLLSPACASFGQFHNEFERGEVFRKLVRSKRERHRRVLRFVRE